MKTAAPLSACAGLMVGRHPIQFRRAELHAQGIRTPAELQRLAGGWARTSGCVIARQRPGTANGFVFLSLEDETGISNMIETPDMFEADRLTITRSRFLVVEGPLHNNNGVVHIRAAKLTRLVAAEVDVRSHDFH